MKRVLLILITVLCVSMFTGCPDTGEYPGLQVTYSGTVNLPSDLPYPEAEWYILVDNISTGTVSISTVTFSGTTGSFSVTDSRGTTDGSTSHLYLFSDIDGDREMSFLNDRIVFLMAQNNKYSNTVIDADIIEISGSLADTADDAYGLSDTGSTPILRVEDKTYWVTTCQAMLANGEFSVMAVSGHAIDLSLLRQTEEGPAIETVDDLYFGDRVRLFTPSAFTGDTAVHSPDGTALPLNIRTISLTYRINAAGYGDYPLYIRTGPDPLVIPATNADGQLVTGEKTQADGSLTFHFRDFDRTTATDGALPDASRSTTIAGYGAFFQTLLFIDTNHDGVFNPGEPSSDIYFHGDGNANGVPDWGDAVFNGGPEGDGDYNDEVSPSGVDSDMNLSVAGFVFEI